MYFFIVWKKIYLVNILKANSKLSIILLTLKIWLSSNYNITASYFLNLILTNISNGSGAFRQIKMSFWTTSKFVSSQENNMSNMKSIYPIKLKNFIKLKRIISKLTRLKKQI